MPVIPLAAIGVISRFYPVKDLVTNENFDAYFEKNKDRPDTYFLDEWLSEEELDRLFK